LKIRQLDHDNVNKLVGVCVDGPVLMAVWKSHTRGSLKDAIGERSSYISDPVIIVALLRDLVQVVIFNFYLTVLISMHYDDIYIYVVMY
jgi:hypothetical protein